METLSGWGRFPRLSCEVRRPRRENEVRALVEAGPLIARGMGRSYGDAALNPRLTVDMRAMNRMLAFDDATGVLVAEAGVTLAEVIETFLPRGWFPLVTPGTRMVTLGGAIAADVHGKNHHVDGSFRACLAWLDLMGPDGVVRRCSRTLEPELFAWTVGGMGLTGVILRAAIRLRPVETGWIRQATLPARDLDAALDAFEAAKDATYSVAWIDCLAAGSVLGRSLVMLGEHARSFEIGRRPRYPGTGRARPSVPLDLPAGLVNRTTVGAFNALYAAAGTWRAGVSLVPWDRYFHPLDAIGSWNRIYGSRGFVQFQCVLPDVSARDGLRAMLEATSARGLGSFLAVLKRFGPGEGPFSFPMAGLTLALDFPAGPDAFALMDRLDRITVDHGGRFYLAKDARLPRDLFAVAEPRAAAFRAFRLEHGLAGQFASAQSERLAL